MPKVDIKAIIKEIRFSKGCECPKYRFKNVNKNKKI